MIRFNVVFVLSALLAGQAFAADWYAKEHRWAGHDPDIIRYEERRARHAEVFAMALQVRPEHD